MVTGCGSRRDGRHAVSHPSAYLLSFRKLQFCSENKSDLFRVRMGEEKSLVELAGTDDTGGGWGGRLEKCAYGAQEEA